MSTERNNVSSRFAKLASMGEIVFHAQDLANLWGILDKNNLYTTLKRYSQKGLLHRTYKGLYSIRKIEDIDPLLLGIKVINEFAYISCETVLAENGIIFQNSSTITIISSKSKKFSLGNKDYQSRKLNNKYLHNMAGIVLEQGYYKANLSRAVADLLYYNPLYYLDASKLINWNEVNKIQKEIGYNVITK